MPKRVALRITSSSLSMPRRRQNEGYSCKSLVGGRRMTIAIRAAFVFCALAGILGSPPHAARAGESQQGGGGQNAIPLWEKGAPGAPGDEPGDKPSGMLYQPPAARPNGAAVVVCPR